MKSTNRILTIMLAIILIQGCIPSLHPLYTEDTLVKLDKLKGVWIEGAEYQQIRKKEKVMGEEKDVMITIYNDNVPESPIWDFRQQENGQYLLVHTDNKGRKAAFDVHIIKLGQDFYLDFFPTDLPSEDSEASKSWLDKGINDLRALHLLPVHTFAKLIITGDNINITMFDPDFLEKLLERRQIRIKHENLSDGGYILTAQPKELQMFVEKYGNEKDAYIENMIPLAKLSDNH